MSNNEQNCTPKKEEAAALRRAADHLDAARLELSSTDWGHLSGVYGTVADKFRERADGMDPPELPFGSVVTDRDGDSWARLHHGWCLTRSDTGAFRWRNLDAMYGPLTVVYKGEA